MDHLAYCDSKAKELEKLLSGKKSMLIRGAAGRKLPYGRVFTGEIIYLIENDGKGLIKAKGTIKSVFNSEKLSGEESEKIILDNMDKLQLTDLQMKRWVGKKYLCLIEIGDVKEISPFTYARAGNMDDWIIVNSIDEIKMEI
ncbi:MAG TPA: hypothetical protein VK856_14975 [Anaerolineaceae bacterium]|nr:hypothetical protein [Anaerolineaceae bacterium]